MRLRCLLVLSLALLSVPGSALAETPEELFRAGKEASARGDYEAAARAFDEAFALEPFPITKYNAAENWFEVAEGREAARAADAYRVALEADDRTSEARLKLDPQIALRARDRLAALSQGLCLVEAKEPLDAKIRVDRIVDAHTPTRFYLKPGKYTVSAAFASGETRTSEIVCRASASVELVWPRPGPRVAAPPPEPRPEPRASPVVDGQMIGGILSLSAGAAFAGTAIGFGVHTLAVRDEFVAGGARNAEQRDEALLFRGLTTGAWVFAGAAAVAGVIVIVTSPAIGGGGDVAPKSPNVSVRLRGGPASLSLDGSF